MKIRHSFYELVSKQPIQSKKTHTMRRGALLQVEFENGMLGYADCHPWEELGDLPLVAQLDLLKNGHCTRLTARSLYFAKIDAKARDQKYNVLSDCKIPLSHYLISELNEGCIEQIKEAWKRGFTHYKIKLGKELAREEEFVKEIIKFWPKIKLRLDFNSKLNDEQFSAFLIRHTDWMKNIDFIEDPFRFDYFEWRDIQEKFGISLAADEYYKAASGHPEAAKILIVKPATQTLKPLDSSQKIIVTSYLDHPLGQISAAYLASQVCREPCGLLSHLVYQPHAYSQMIHHQGPYMQPVQGHGFGFDELLMKEKFI